MADGAWEGGDSHKAEKLYRKALRVSQRRGVDEQAWRVEYNLGSLLRTSGRAADALPHLRAASHAFDSLPDGYRLLVPLAECEDELGQTQAAISRWEKIAELALTVRDREFTVYALSAAATLQLRVKDHAVAEKTVKCALQSNPTNEQRAILLRQKFEVAVLRENEHDANRAFEEASQYAKQHEFMDVFVDLHMMAGDYNWKEGAYELTADSYSLALGTALNLDGDAAARVSTHMLRKVMSVPMKARGVALRRMEQRIISVVGGDVEWHSRSKVARLVTWPLEVAHRLTAAEKEGRHLSERKIDELISSVIEAC